MDEDESNDLSLAEMIQLNLHAIQCVIGTVGEAGLPKIIDARSRYTSLLAAIERGDVSNEAAEKEFGQIEWGVPERRE